MLTVALPFTSLRLKAPRPRVLPRGYPISLSTLGDHVRRHRLDLGLGQRTLGMSLGVRAETVANWELGRTRPFVRHLAGLIRFLGYDPDAPDEGLAGRVHAYRRTLGLSQAELAARLDLDEGTVVDLERGRRKLSRRVRRAVERFLAREGTN